MYHPQLLKNPARFRAKMERLKRFSGPSPESQGQNLAVIVSCVPSSLDRGLALSATVTGGALYGCERAADAFTMKND